jgi:N-acetylmuramoyl-L-alanine amidase
MACYHKVAQGEYLSLIALNYGFTDYMTVYNHPKNAQFRQKRPNPNVIYPGDVLYIPDKQEKQEQRGTAQRHQFTKSGATVRVRIQLKDKQRKIMPNVSYTLKVGSEVKTGKTDGQGILEQDVPIGVPKGLLTVPDYGCAWELQIGHLDPIDTVTGYQARLKNLGYPVGPVDGIVGPLTRNAVMMFQADYPPLAVDGICGPKTQAKLKEVYGY